MGVRVRRLPLSSANGLVDRLLRGRTWVACIGLLLAGIVFLNVSVLELNGDIAVTSEQAAELRNQNSDLREEVARLGSSERIQRVAEARGFVMPRPGAVTYVEADPESDGQRAAVALGKSIAGATASEAGDEEPRPDGGEVAAAPAPTAELPDPSAETPAPTATAPSPAAETPAPTAEVPAVPAG